MLRKTSLSTGKKFTLLTERFKYVKEYVSVSVRRIFIAVALLIENLIYDLNIGKIGILLHITT